MRQPIPIHRFRLPHAAAIFSIVALLAPTPAAMARPAIDADGPRVGHDAFGLAAEGIEWQPPAASVVVERTANAPTGTSFDIVVASAIWDESTGFYTTAAAGAQARVRFDDRVASLGGSTKVETAIAETPTGGDQLRFSIYREDGGDLFPPATIDGSAADWATIWIGTNHTSNSLDLQFREPSALTQGRSVWYRSGTAFSDVAWNLDGFSSPWPGRFFITWRGQVGKGINRVDFFVDVHPLSLPCVPGPAALCLNDGRFRVEVDWLNAAGETGVGQAVPRTNDSGAFWFFNSSNVEMVVKVLDACQLNNSFWIFMAGLTNVQVDVTVTDTKTGGTWTRRNPLKTPFRPIQDTSALPCD